MAKRSGSVITLVTVLLCLFCGQLCFVQMAPPAARPVVLAPKFRSVTRDAGEYTSTLVPAAMAVSCFLAAFGLRVSSSVSCSAKKKGVRVVDGKEIPWNLFGPKAPYKATIVANHTQPHTLTEDTGDGNWETVHLTIDHGGNLPYLEGQSIGVIAPGPDKKGETPAKVRLYSIASSAPGDDETSNTVSLCVKRNVVLDGEYANRDVGEDTPDKAGTHFPEHRVYRGVSSNFVCDSSPGDKILITGPTGAEMLLPDDPNATIIMLATGTGIAPMRSYLRRMFHDAAGAAADGSRTFNGFAWLFLGVPYAKSILYDDEHQSYRENFPEQFRCDYAVSREDKNAAGEKMYIQTKMAEHAEELWSLMQKPNTHVYMCGLKGMEKGMKECFGPLAEKHGLDWDGVAKQMKKEKRYHVEVY